MSNTGLIGKKHNAHLDWLLNTWMSSNFSSSPVCFLEGFSGTGKTSIARELLHRVSSTKQTAIMIEAPEIEADPTDDLLLELAVEFNKVGRDELAEAIDSNRPLLDVLSSLVNDPILIIIDEFQRSMRDTRAMTLGGFPKVGGFSKTLTKLANNRQLKGRILLLTNRFVERARWSEGYDIRTLDGMSPDDALELLEHYAGEEKQLDEIAPERRLDVVKSLGGNPRAIKLLIHSLRYDSLDDLIGIQPELWETHDKDVSPDLVAQLEKEILERTLSQLSDDYILRLHRLSVYRKRFKREGIEYLFDEKSVYAQFKRGMIDRFLMEHHKGWFNLHPIVREIGLQKLGQNSNRLQEAHRIASRYYTRHFRAKELKGWGTLGSYFVEARYHLVKAQQQDDLQKIAIPFQEHIFSTLKARTRIPNNAEELDERIAVLSALLETPGPKNLEYHLARLFQARNQRNDLRRALNHAHRSRSNKSAATWLLCSDLLAQMGQLDEAVTLLKKGIRSIPENNLASLFTKCSRFLAEMEKQEEAIILLKQGIEIIPPEKDIASLYISCSELLVQGKQYKEAIALLEEGINRIPSSKSLAGLYHRYGELLAKQKRYKEAIKVLKEGIQSIPTDKDLTSLYYLYADILTKMGKNHSAISALQHGINRISVNKNIFSLYSLCGQLMFELGDQDNAISVLKEGIERIPPEQGVVTVYKSCVKLLVFSQRITEAIEILLDGIAKIPPEYNPYSLFDFILILYAALRDQEGIIKLIKTRGRDSQRIYLAQTLLYQVQERWEDAAEYAKNVRKNGTQNPILANFEAFCWLCSGKAELALEAVFTNLNNEQSFIQWLHAFIQLRLGNLEQAKQALAAYLGNETDSVEDVDQATLLNLWDQPSTTLNNYDLAYYFPILPTALTGLPYSVTRIVYHPSVLPADIKSKSSTISRPTRKVENSKLTNTTQEVVNMSEKDLEQYVDFDLHIKASGDVTASSREGEEEDNISTEVPSNIRLSLKLIEKGETDGELLKEVGRSLHDWLFPNPINTHLQKTEAVARHENAKLRLRMRIEPSTIASLPLEFIYRAAGGYFLATNPKTAFSRYLSLALPPGKVRRRETPLHMLVIVADPTDQVRLDPNEWETIITEALNKPLTENKMTLKVVKRATRREIRNAMLEQKPDIIQFIGHGIYQHGKGYLALVDEDTNETWRVDDERFANIFAGYDDHLGLISMATCDSSQSNDPQGFLGIAPQLVQRGTPAVLAMQYEVKIKTAKIFLEDFYRCVAAHKPIDWAVQSARNAISLEFGLDNREFATPVLYMRAENGNVF